MKPFSALFLALAILPILAVPSERTVEVSGRRFSEGSNELPNVVETFPKRNSESLTRTLKDAAAFEDLQLGDDFEFLDEFDIHEGEELTLSGQSAELGASDANYVNADSKSGKNERKKETGNDSGHSVDRQSGLNGDEEDDSDDENDDEIDDDDMIIHDLDDDSSSETDAYLDAEDHLEHDDEYLNPFDAGDVDMDEDDEDELSDPEGDIKLGGLSAKKPEPELDSREGLNNSNDEEDNFEDVKDQFEDVEFPGGENSVDSEREVLDDDNETVGIYNENDYEDDLDGDLAMPEDEFEADNIKVSGQSIDESIEGAEIPGDFDEDLFDGSDDHVEAEDFENGNSVRTDEFRGDDEEDFEDEEDNEERENNVASREYDESVKQADVNIAGQSVQEKFEGGADDIDSEEEDNLETQFVTHDTYESGVDEEGIVGEQVHRANDEEENIDGEEDFEDEDEDITVRGQGINSRADIDRKEEQDARRLAKDEELDNETNGVRIELEDSEEYFDDENEELTVKGQAVNVGDFVGDDDEEDFDDEDEDEFGDEVVSHGDYVANDRSNGDKAGEFSVVGQSVGDEENIDDEFDDEDELLDREDEDEDEDEGAGSASGLSFEDNFIDSNGQDAIGEQDNEGAFADHELHTTDVQDIPVNGQSVDEVDLASEDEDNDEDDLELESGQQKMTVTERFSQGDEAHYEDADGEEDGMGVDNMNLFQETMNFIEV